MSGNEIKSIRKKTEILLREIENLKIDDISVRAKDILSDMETEAATPEEIEAARDEYGSDEIEIDPDAMSSRSDEGTWVAAWVWIGGGDGT